MDSRAGPALPGSPGAGTLDAINDCCADSWTARYDDDDDDTYLALYIGAEGFVASDRENIVLRLRCGAVWSALWSLSASQSRREW